MALDASVHIAGAGGRRTVPLASFFTGYRQTALEPGELLTAIEIPKALAPVDPILQSRQAARGRYQHRGGGVLDGSRWRGPRNARACLRSAAWRRFRCACTRRKRQCLGQHWNQAAVGARAGGSRADAQADQRSSRFGRIPRCKWRRVWWKNSGGSGRRRLHEDRRPASVRTRAPRARHRRRRSTPTICAGAFPGILHAWPVMAPHAHALLTQLGCSRRRWTSRGVCTVLTADDVPGEGDSGVKPPR